jgi:hypothetical protein
LTGKADKSDKLNQFASTTSAELASVISNETGSGALVFGTSPTISTPAITLSQTTSTTAGRLARTGGQLRLGNGTSALTFTDDASIVISQSQVTGLTTATITINGTAVALGGTITVNARLA